LEISLNTREQVELSKHYEKESTNFFEIAKRYREKLNPINNSLPQKDIDHIVQKIENKVRSELNLRISNGYQGIDLNLIHPMILNLLKSLRIIY